MANQPIAGWRRTKAEINSQAYELSVNDRLDVHHLDPVSEGVRRTTLKDVTVLCANHHRQAHFEMKSPA